MDNGIGQSNQALIQVNLPGQSIAGEVQINRNGVGMGGGRVGGVYSQIKITFAIVINHLMPGE